MLRPLVALEGNRWAWTDASHSCPLLQDAFPTVPITVLGSQAAAICGLLSEGPERQERVPATPGLYAQQKQGPESMQALFLVCIPPALDDLLPSGARSPASSAPPAALSQLHALLERQLLGLACMLSAAVVVHMGQEGSPEFRYGTDLVQLLNTASHQVHSSWFQNNTTFSRARSTHELSVDELQAHSAVTSLGTGPRSGAGTASFDGSVTRQPPPVSQVLPRLVLLTQTDRLAAQGLDVARMLEDMVLTSPNSAGLNSTASPSNPATSSLPHLLAPPRTHSQTSAAATATAAAAAATAGAAKELYRTTCSALLEEVLQQCAAIGGAPEAGAAGMQVSLHGCFSDLDAIPLPVPHPSQTPLGTPPAHVRTPPSPTAAPSRTGVRPTTANTRTSAELPVPCASLHQRTPLTRALAAVGALLEACTPPRVIEGQVLRGQLIKCLGTAFTELCPNASSASSACFAGSRDGVVVGADAASTGSVHASFLGLLRQGSIEGPITNGSNLPGAELGSSPSAASVPPSRFSLGSQAAAAAEAARCVPSVSQVWAYMAHVECRDALETGLQEYQESMRPALYMGSSEREIDALHKRAWAAVRKEYLDRTAAIQDVCTVTRFRELRARCEEHLLEVKRQAREAPPPSMRAPSRGGMRVSMSGAAALAAGATPVNRRAVRARLLPEDMDASSGGGGRQLTARSRLATSLSTMHREPSRDLDTLPPAVLLASRNSNASSVAGQTVDFADGVSLPQLPASTLTTRTSDVQPMVRPSSWAAAGASPGGAAARAAGRGSLQPSGSAEALPSMGSMAKPAARLPLLTRPMDEGVLRDAKPSYAFLPRANREGAATLALRLAGLSSADGRHSAGAMLLQQVAAAGAGAGKGTRGPAQPYSEPELGASSLISMEQLLDWDGQPASNSATLLSPAAGRVIRSGPIASSGPTAQTWQGGADTSTAAVHVPGSPSAKLRGMMDAWDRQGAAHASSSAAVRRSSGAGVRSSASGIPAAASSHRTLPSASSVPQ